MYAVRKSGMRIRLINVPPFFISDVLSDFFSSWLPDDFLQVSRNPHAEEESSGCESASNFDPASAVSANRWTKKPLSGVRNVYANRKGVFTKTANKLILLAFYKKLVAVQGLEPRTSRI